MITRFATSAIGAGLQKYRSMLAGNFAYPYNLITTMVGSDTVTLGWAGSDNSGNIYATGWSNISGLGQQGQVAKYDAFGNIVWQQHLGDGTNQYLYGGAVDPSTGNLYACGGQSSLDHWIVRYDTNGTVAWQRRIGNNSYSEEGRICVLDTVGGYVYTGGTWFTSGGIRGTAMAQYTLSGTYQRTLGAWVSGTDSSGGAFAADSSAAYIAVNNASGGNVDLYLVKQTLLGASTWQRRLGGTGNDGARGLALDSAGNILIGGDSSSGVTSTALLIAKYNSSGTIQWQRRLGGTTSDGGFTIAVDKSDDSAYLIGYRNNYAAGVIAKYNSSGTLQWQRDLTVSGGTNLLIEGASIGPDGQLYVGGYVTVSSLTRGFVLKLPTDGSKTGTYAVGSMSFTYAVGSLTEAAASLTDQAATINVGGFSATNTTTSYTSTASTHTISTTLI